MSAHEIDVRELASAVQRVGNAFATKDVSEQPQLRATHPTLQGHSHWHAFVGRALSQSRGHLGIEQEGHTARGARWVKRGSAARAPTPVPSTAAPSTGSDDLGPQSPSDPWFTAKMRMHQSWWRAQVLKVPYGTGPTPNATSRYGNMLAADDAEAGKNFLCPDIFTVARARLELGAGTIEPFRLLRNLLSSQPMCFNLFGLLVRNAERATRLMRAWIGDEVASVRCVKIEHAPSPSDEHLRDRTAFDAYVEYARDDGSLVAVGIETKLTDSFSQNPYDGPLYRRWMLGPSSPFRPEAWDEVARPKHNQLWRNHLLALSLRDRAGSSISHVRSAVVHHPLDTDGASTVASYRKLIVDGDETFTCSTLEDIVTAFERAVTTDEERAWLTAFRKRYLALDLSAAAAHPRS